MKIKIEIKSRLTGKILFEYEKENNTIKETVSEAAKTRANLSGANLSGADLSRADLYGANLSRADLSGANLYGADLSGANLSRADLSRADLYGANLSGADLSRANLYGADLSGANLSRADLSGANLYGADLSGADLSGANLYGADLSGAKNSEWAIALTRILPEGDIIGYKKAVSGKKFVIVKLLIPKEAKRSSAFGRKCRAEYADVLEIEGAKKANSQHDSKFIYKVGKRVTPTEPFNEDWTNECSSGIHFFITRLEAEKY